MVMVNMWECLIFCLPQTMTSYIENMQKTYEVVKHSIIGMLYYYVIMYTIFC